MWCSKLSVNYHMTLSGNTPTISTSSTTAHLVVTTNRKSVETFFCMLYEISPPKDNTSTPMLYSYLSSDSDEDTASRWWTWWRYFPYKKGVLQDHIKNFEH